MPYITIYNVHIFESTNPTCRRSLFMGTGLGRFGFPATSSSSGATGWGSPKCRGSEERPPRPVSTRPRHSHRTWIPCGDLHGHPATTWTQRLRQQKKWPEVVLKGVICFRLVSRGSRYYVYIIFVYNVFARVYTCLAPIYNHSILKGKKLPNQELNHLRIASNGGIVQRSFLELPTKSAQEEWTSTNHLYRNPKS